MELREKKIIHLPVYTQSGKELGKISGFGIDTETHTIVRYYVKSGRLIEGLFEKELIIAASQVISITNEKMIVEDLILKVNEGIFNKNQLAKNKVAPPVTLSRTEK